MWSTRIAAARQLLLYACRVLIPGQATFRLGATHIKQHNTDDTPANPANQSCCNDREVFRFCRLTVENCEEHVAENQITLAR